MATSPQYEHSQAGLFNEGNNSDDSDEEDEEEKHFLPGSPKLTRQDSGRDAADTELDDLREKDESK